MCEWKEYRLGEIADVQTGPFGSQLHQSDYVDVGIPSIMPVNIGDRMNISTEKIVYITEEDAMRLSRYRVQKGDIVYSRRGDVEKCAYINEDEAGWLCGTGCLRIRIDSTHADSKFVAYYLSTEDMKSWISNNAVGTTMPNLNSSILQQVPLSLPSLDKQKQIASILSSLDDKIDLLNRENATLEAMAETLFRQWFIEDAKEDWEEGTIDMYANHYKESINPQKQPTTMFWHYSIPAFDNGKKPIDEMGEEIQSSKYIIPSNCILFSKLNPHKDKRVWLILDNVSTNAICSTEFQIVKPKEKKYLYFLYGWLTNKENYEEIASGVGGTSGSHQRIDPKSIFTFACPYVNIDVIHEYNKVVEPLFLKQRENQKQIIILTEQRDRLLPKLMSNEINIK
jgi:type I restriction enzyme S subunit